MRMQMYGHDSCARMWDIRAQKNRRTEAIARSVGVRSGAGRAASQLAESVEDHVGALHHRPTRDVKQQIVAVRVVRVFLEMVFDEGGAFAVGRFHEPLRIVLGEGCAGA